MKKYILQFTDELFQLIYSPEILTYHGFVILLERFLSI